MSLIENDKSNGHSLVINQFVTQDYKPTIWQLIIQLDYIMSCHIMSLQSWATNCFGAKLSPNSIDKILRMDKVWLQTGLQPACYNSIHDD